MKRRKTAFLIKNILFLIYVLSFKFSKVISAFDNLSNT